MEEKSLVRSNSILDAAAPVLSCEGGLHASWSCRRVPSGQIERGGDCQRAWFAPTQPPVEEARAQDFP